MRVCNGCGVREDKVTGKENEKQKKGKIHYKHTVVSVLCWVFCVQLSLL